MADQAQCWEYRVQTVGSIFGTSDEQVEAMLNAWGEEGWEVFAAYSTPDRSGKVTVVARRPLTETAALMRSISSAVHA